MLSPLSVLFTAFLLSSTLARAARIPTLTSLNEPRIECHNSRIKQPFHKNDCMRLITDLQATTWFAVPTTFGNTQPAPGTLPKSQGHRSCRFKIYAKDEIGVATQSIIASAELPSMHKIIQECLDPWSGYTGGLMGFGSLNLFQAYFGGAVLRSLDGANATTNLIEEAGGYEPRE